MVGLLSTTEEPRLSARLLRSLYGTSVPTTDEIRVTQKSLLTKATTDESANLENDGFPLKRFLVAAKSTAEQATITAAHTNFCKSASVMAELNGISVFDRSPAGTLYSLLTSTLSTTKDLEDSKESEQPLGKTGEECPISAKIERMMSSSNITSEVTSYFGLQSREKLVNVITNAAILFRAENRIRRQQRSLFLNSENENANEITAERSGRQSFADFSSNLVFQVPTGESILSRWQNRIQVVETRRRVALRRRTASTSVPPSSSSAHPEPITWSPEEEETLWLLDACTSHCAMNDTGIWSPITLATEIASVCSSANGCEDTLQISLFELLGESALELLLEVFPRATVLSKLTKASIEATIAKRDRSASSPTVNTDDDADLARALAATESASQSAAEVLAAYEAAAAVVRNEAAVPFDSLTANQKKKALQREKRELERVLALSEAESQKNGGNQDWLRSLGFSQAYLEEERALGLQKNRTFEAFQSDNLAAPGTRVYYEKIGLPAGTTRKQTQYMEEVCIPAAARPPPPPPGELVEISTLEPFSQLAFRGTKALNRMQSRVFQSAYHTSQNLLICAPTGAGKTNVAMLTILQYLRGYVRGTGGLSEEDEVEENVQDEGVLAESMEVDDSKEDGPSNDIQRVPRRRGVDPSRKWWIERGGFKAIYIAPMKALAQEVVTKFQERLAPLGIRVREYTGDMQLTRAEVAEADILVCTPEKYDVATRKGGEGSLATLVGLVIIDEVHLLADERGAVLETIVARTQRLVEARQRIVRIVGLSATLPNYADVAQFLGVNLTTGLHFFGQEFRPVPLQQTFIGLTEKNRAKKAAAMNRVAFDKAMLALKAGKQVMIFVHSRKETSTTLDAILELCQVHGTQNLLDPYFEPEAEEDSDGTTKVLSPEMESRKTAHLTRWKKSVDKSRSTELQRFFTRGVGTHHAGMLRADRTLTEQMFEAGAIKLLACTATLAWGVNLPAHTVILKGTELYDPARGGFNDLSMLDVLQIFGRAGRPQYDTSGHAVLITSHASLGPYLGKLVAQTAIESALLGSLADHLNAEIVNGTVTTISEATTWLSYTFLFVRMRRAPLAYGISEEVISRDPQLVEKRNELIASAADLLDQCMMIRWDRRSGVLGTTELGRIASHYYLRHGTIDAFNRLLHPFLSPNEALRVLCSSAEFDQLKIRAEELAELEVLRKSVASGGNSGGKTHSKSKGARNVRQSRGKSGQMNMETNAGSNEGSTTTKLTADDTAGKVAILLTAYLAHERVSGFTLVSDTAYVVQNGSRITRALFEICLRRGWSSMAVMYLSLARSIDRGVGLSAITGGEELTPLRQFSSVLPREVLERIEDCGLSIDMLRQSSEGELSQMLHTSRKNAESIMLAVHRLPQLEVTSVVQPITRGIVRLTLRLSVDFEWDERWHAPAEVFHVWVEDSDSTHIHHSETVSFSRPPRGNRPREKGDANEGAVKVLELTIPVPDPLPAQYYVRVLSDNWVSCDSLTAVSFRHVLLPSLAATVATDLLAVHPIPVTALAEPSFEALYSKRFTHFNPVQSQLFHVLYHTDRSVLVGAPTGSGKTITAELAILRLLRTHPGKKVVYVAPLKALARERLADWSQKLGATPANGGLGLSVVELTGESTPDVAVLDAADILIVTPEKWDGISRQWQRRSYVRAVGLVVLDEVHLLGVDRGAVLEALVSRMRFVATQTGAPLRFLALSTALANAGDLADWLGVTSDSVLSVAGSTSGAGSDSVQSTNTRGACVGGVGLYNFRPSVRPVPTTIHIAGFAGKHYCPRMASMNKPAYAAIAEHSPTKPVLIFVASRRQTRLTALDLIALAAADGDPKKFLHMPEGDDEDALLAAAGLTTTGPMEGGNDRWGGETMAAILPTIKDRALADALSYGIGLHHAGLCTSDRLTTERLFLNGAIQILVATATLAWGVNLPCHLVIVKGTEYFDTQGSARAAAAAMVAPANPDGESANSEANSTNQLTTSSNPSRGGGYVDMPVTDILQMIGRAGRPQFDRTAVAVVLCAEPKKHFLRRFLHAPFPVESALLSSVTTHLSAEIAGGTICCLRDGVEWLTWTYFYRRLARNPSFYGLVDSSAEGVAAFLLRIVTRAVEELFSLGLVVAELPESEEADENSETQEKLPPELTSVTPTALGVISSFYYLYPATASGLVEQFATLTATASRTVTDAPSAQNRSRRNSGRTTHIFPEVAPGTVSPVDVLWALCNAQEFSGIPVRHNEDGLNGGLAVTLGLSADNRLGGNGTTGPNLNESVPPVLGSPHVKSFLLVMSALCGAPLPISDYGIDQRGVLEQLGRVMAAAIDIAVECNFISVLAALHTLSRLVNNQIVNGPGAEWRQLLKQVGAPSDSESKLCSSLCKATSRVTNGVASLVPLLQQPRKKTENLVSQVLSSGHHNFPSLVTNVLDLPLLSISVSLCLLGNEEKTWHQLTSGMTVRLPVSQAFELEIRSQLVRGHIASRNDKPPSWSVIVLGGVLPKQIADAAIAGFLPLDNLASLGTSADSIALQSMKRITLRRVGSSTVARLTCQAPDHAIESWPVTISVASAVMAGLDVSFTFNTEIVP